MIKLGLTGSIGMGKSTTAALFAACGDLVIDADAIVHDLYKGVAVPLVEAAFNGVTRDGAIDRAKLSERVLGNEANLRRLEAIVHPLVRSVEAERLIEAKAAGVRLAVIDVPLMFETGRHREMNAVLVVTASPEVQRQRVLARAGMNAERFASILAKQMPDAEKRRKAHFVLDTSQGHIAAKKGVAAIRRAALSLA
ncbi:MAG: dephospho-CoA kinase [Pseudomonadota bacterium]